MADNIMQEADGEAKFVQKTCPLLRIPTEIRLEIYRYLLLPTTLIYFCPERPPPCHFPKLLDIGEGSVDDSEDEWVDEDATDDSELDSLMSDVMHDVEREMSSDDDDSSFFDSDSEEEKFQRHLAIYGTNRRIHDEAQSLFYSEAILTLEPGDIFALAKKPQNLKFGYANHLAWKHNPLYGIGEKDRNGAVTYRTSQLAGDIEPHIFAKFRKIFLDAYFDDEHTQYLEMWIDDETHVFKPEDIRDFKKLLRHSSLFKDLFKILSNSHCITSLEIKLEVEILADSNLITSDIEDEIDEEDEIDIEKAAKLNQIMDIANQKATELFLDSKVMDPLLKLTNVSKCEIRFGFENLEEEEAYKPPKKYVKMLRNLEDKIESNFKEEFEGPGSA